jgi:hypothetical protein
MGLNLILLVIVIVASCITILQTRLDSVTNSRRWIPISVALLICTLLSFLFFQQQAGYISIVLWFAVAGLPSLGFRFSDRLYYQGNFEGARRVKSWLRWIHPLQNWPWQDALYRAYTQASGGNYNEAIHLLESAQSHPPTLEQQCTLYYFQCDWGGLVNWWEGYPNRIEIESKLDLTRHYLRALGEIGEVNKLLQLMRDHYDVFAQLPMLHDYCYLYAFAFGGRAEQANKLLHTPVLEHIGPDMRTIWIATSHCTAGHREMGAALLKPLLRTTKDGIARKMAASRLQHCFASVGETLTVENQQFLQQIEREWNEKQRMISLWH